MQGLSAGHQAWKHRLIVNCLASLWSCIWKESKFLFFKSKTLLQVNICSVSAWFQSNIDLLIRNTQLSAKPDWVIIIQRGSACILCDCLAVAVGCSWPGSLVDPAQQSGGTWGKYWARGAGHEFCYSRAVINAGTASGSPYHTAVWMTAVRSSYIMRGGGGGGGAALRNVGRGHE